MTWRERAACRDHPDPELFFPKPTDTTRLKQAKAVCARCPVVRACLDDSLKEEIRESAFSAIGIRGGLTATERLFKYRMGEFPPTCGRGHVRSADTVHIKNMGFICIVCEQERAAKTRRRALSAISDPVAVAAQFLRDNPHLSKHCRRGHPWVPETTRIRGIGETKRNPYRTCLTCEKAAKQRARARGIDLAGACKRGHPWDEHARVSTGGYRYCRECRRLNERKRREALKKVVKEDVS